MTYHCEHKHAGFGEHPRIVELAPTSLRGLYQCPKCMRLYKSTGFGVTLVTDETAHSRRAKMLETMEGIR